MAITIYSLKLFALLHLYKVGKIIKDIMCFIFSRVRLHKVWYKPLFFPDSYPRNKYIKDKKQIPVVASLH